MSTLPEFFDVNLPFGFKDVDYDESKPCFEDTVRLHPGMLLDCETGGGRKYLLVGHMNSAKGGCGCCPYDDITFVYRYLEYTLPEQE